MANRASSDQSEFEKEEWRPVAGWEGLYEVSSLGRVRSLDREVFTPDSPQGAYYRRYKGKVLKQAIGTDGRYHLVFSSREKKQHVLVARVVCEAFHGGPGTKTDAAHNNGDQLDNRASNLRWATRKENMADTIVHGTHNRGQRHGMSKLSPDDVNAIRSSSDTLTNLAARFGVSFQAISDVRRRKSWRHI